MAIAVLKLVIVSPEKTIYNGVANKVTLPGELGSFTVFPSHAPLISSLKKGRVLYTVNGVNEEVDIQEGFVEIKENVVSVCIEQ